MLINKIQDYLLNIGMKSNHLGYYYLCSLLLYRLSGNEILPLKSNGYTYIARINNVNVDNVIKNIDSSIDYIFSNGNIEYLYDIFGDTIQEKRGKPTNKQFIMTICDKLLQELT